MSHQRGAEAVATLAALPFHEALLVSALRVHCEGPDAVAVFGTELAEVCGPERAGVLLGQADDFFRMVLAHVRRPVLRHGLSCSCVGADEAVLAHLVSIAASGEREDAMLMACLLVRADWAPAVVSLASEVGISLMRETRGPAAQGLRDMGHGEARATGRPTRPSARRLH